MALQPIAQAERSNGAYFMGEWVEFADNPEVIEITDYTLIAPDLAAALESEQTEMASYLLELAVDWILRLSVLALLFDKLA